MMKIVWADSFSVGHPEIDHQHKKWIEIFNKSYDRMMSHDIDTLSSIGIDAIKEMRQYAEMHFKFEEEYMKGIGYPDLKSHAKIHQAFTVKLARIHEDFETGIRQLNSEIMKLIENWLVEHILSEDQKYKTFALSS